MKFIMRYSICFANGFIVGQTTNSTVAKFFLIAFITFLLGLHDMAVQQSDAQP